MPINLLDRQNPAGPDSIGFIYIFFRFLSYKDGSGIFDLGRYDIIYIICCWLVEV